MPIITLLTDFGLSDGYVAAMKGVILGLAPDASIVDLTHQVPPQDIYAGAFVLGTTYPFFPRDTIHVAVVDPGVGTERRAVLLETSAGRFLAPDNGVLSYVLEDAGAAPGGSPALPPGVISTEVPPGATAYALENTKLFLPQVSRTFHGRDVFAPVAARLAGGLPPGGVGPRLPAVHAFQPPRAARRVGATGGVVIHVDAFGNLITNLREADLPPGRQTVRVGDYAARELSRSYQEEGELVAIVGSSGRLEIAARNGSAADKLGIGRWAEVLMEPA